MNGEPTFPSSGMIRVVASAGAGKTYALAFRYLTLLLGGKDPAEELGRLLAVTFTRKAAGEMRERVLTWLEALPRPQRPEILELRRDLARATGLSEEVLAARAERALETVFERWSFFAVGTIDAFLLSAARASAFEVGLPHGFSVILNPHPNVRRAFLALLSAAGTDETLRRNLEDLLDEKYLSLENLNWDIVGGFLRDQRALHQQVAGVAVFPTPLEGVDVELRRALEEASRAAGRFLRCLQAGEIEIGSGAAFLRQLEEMAAGPSISAFTKLKSELWKRENLSRLVRNKKCANKVGPEEEAAWSGLRKSLETVARYHALALGNPALRLETLLDGAQEEEARRKNAVPLDRVTRVLASHLAEGGLPSVFLSLGERYLHLLVDEFQDTSEVQWQALKPLAEEALGRGGSFFFVGDPKQAIYRFRGGAPHLFEQVYEELAGPFGGRSQTLPKNHRSREVLVEFFNETFSEKTLKEWSGEVLHVSQEEYERFFGPVFRSAVQKSADHRSGGYVRIVQQAAPPETEGETPLERAAREAAEGLLPDLLGRGYRPGEVAFLVRTNDEARTIAKILEGSGHRVATESAARVTSHPTVQELLALLRFLDAPTDDLSFAAFALGTLMEGAAPATSAELHALLARWAADREGALYRAYREAFPQAWKELVEPLFQGVGYLAPYDLLQDFLERSKAFDRFPEEEPFLTHFLEVVSAKEREGAGTAGSLLAALEEEPEDEALEVPLPEAVDAFRVLTVHKAKGLGFPVILLLLPKLKFSREGDLLLQEGWRSLWVRTREIHRNFSPSLAKAYRESQLLSLRDELSVLYVALTRAEDELYVVLDQPQEKTNRKRSLPFEAPKELGVPPAPRRAPAEPASLLVRPPVRSPWRFRILPPADPGYRPPPPEAWEAVRMGKWLHRLLESGFRGGEKGQGLLPAVGPGSVEARQLADRIGALLAHPALGPLLAPPAGDVLNEVEILDADGQVFRVDRLIVEEDRVTVVDWKTGREVSEDHRHQVARYGRLVSALYPGRQVLGRLVYLVLERVEEVSW